SVHFGHRSLDAPLVTSQLLGEQIAMKFILAAATALLISTAANAEIMCSEHAGCWETGKQIRLVHSRQETSVPSRDGKARTRIIGIADDMPHQTFPPTQAVRRR